ncbi:MAG: T9SS type A sorting domain-containing protein [Bacteroidota bacterium]
MKKMKCFQTVAAFLLWVGALTAQPLNFNSTSTELPKTITVNGGEQVNCPGCDEVLSYLVEIWGTNLDAISLPNFELELTVDDGNGNSVTVYQPVNETDFVQLSGTYGQYNERAFKADYDVQLDLSSLCSINNSVSGTVRARMVVDDGTRGYRDFPICNHRQRGAAFSCEVFSNIPCTGSCVSQNYIGASSVTSHSCASGTLQQRQGAEQQGSAIAPSLQVTPNPFQGELTLQWSGEEEIRQIELFDSQGRRLRLLQASASGQSAGSQSWDLSELQKGIYFLHVKTEKQSKTMKLLKL